MQQQKGALPPLPQPCMHPPSAAILHGHGATVDYLFISYSSPHSIHFPLTNQAALLGKTGAYFNKMWILYTQIHSAILDVACHRTERHSCSPDLDTSTECPLRKTEIWVDEDRTSNSGKSITPYTALISQSGHTDTSMCVSCICMWMCSWGSPSKMCTAFKTCERVKKLLCHWFSHDTGGGTWPWWVCSNKCIVLKCRLSCWKD